MPRPLSPAFFTSLALGLVDDAASIPAPGAAPPVVTPRYRVPNVVAEAAANPTDGGWSAAFVQHVGYWSHFDYRMDMSAWPLPHTASCTELADFAASHSVITDDAPEPGDIYLLWSPAKKVFVRAGIVLAKNARIQYPNRRTGYECLTVDGDTTRHGLLRGPHTALTERVLSPEAGDRFIRWRLLERKLRARPRAASLPNRRAA